MPVSVLVVDDDPSFRALAVHVLKLAGLEVVAQAATAAEALGAAKAFKPDAALVDVDLPDLNGIELATELGALPDSPRVLLTSADPDAAWPDDIRRCGANGFLHKGELPSRALVELLAA
jgi:DNA-binding NarL/FixJ family response regulator